MLRDEHLQGRDIALHILGGDKVDHAQIQIIVADADRSEYISALKQIRTEGSDEYLIEFFFKTAIGRMKNELSQKRKNSLPMMFF